MERSGGVAAIVCDATENTVRHGSCDGCLANVGQVTRRFPEFRAHLPGALVMPGNFKRGENPHPKYKSSSEQVCLNSFRWVPDSCHREEGKSSRELFENVRVNSLFFFQRCRNDDHNNF